MVWYEIQVKYFELELSSRLYRAKCSNSNSIFGHWPCILFMNIDEIQFILFKIQCRYFQTFSNMIQSYSQHFSNEESAIFSFSISLKHILVTMGGINHSKLSFPPQWYFYYRQKDNPGEWKCQPNRWLTPELERHEIKWGSITLLVTNSISAIIAAWIINGGWSMVYYKIDEYGLLWFFLQWPTVFLVQASTKQSTLRVIHFFQCNKNPLEIFLFSRLKLI